MCSTTLVAAADRDRMLASVGLAWTYYAGGAAHLIVCLNGIQETVGPIYQAIKLWHDNVPLLRLAVATNCLVRAPYWLAMMVLLARLPAGQIAVGLWAFLFFGYAVGLCLDYVWTSKMVRRLKRGRKAAE